MPRFSNEYKESLVEKIIGEPSRSIRSVAVEAQVGVSSLHKWVQDTKTKTNLTSTSLSDAVSESSTSWSSAKKLHGVIESFSLSDADLNHYPAVEIRIYVRTQSPCERTSE